MYDPQPGGSGYGYHNEFGIVPWRKIQSCATGFLLDHHRPCEQSVAVSIRCSVAFELHYTLIEPSRPMIHAFIDVVRVAVKSGIWQESCLLLGFV